MFAGSLWVSVVLNPKCDIEDRQKWTSALETWSRLDICPLEDPDYRHQTSRRPTPLTLHETEEQQEQQHESTNEALSNEIDKKPVILGKKEKISSAN